MNLTKGLFLAAMVCFILAAFKAGELPWVAIGLTALAGGHLAKN